MLSILIADDHTLFRRGLISLLDESGEFQVVGEASSGPEAVRLALERHPDVVLMDVHMPGGGGAAAVAQLRELLPNLPVIMLSVSDKDADLLDAIRAGARGYLLKNAESEELFDALRQVASGQVVLSPALAGVLFRHIAQDASALAKPEMPLSLRELEILRLVATGLTNREIAARLYLSENTVKTHLARILEKLNATSRSQAVEIARMRGWLT